MKRISTKKQIKIFGIIIIIYFFILWARFLGLFFVGSNACISMLAVFLPTFLIMTNKVKNKNKWRHFYLIQSLLLLGSLFALLNALYNYFSLQIILFLVNMLIYWKVFKSPTKKKKTWLAVLFIIPLILFLIYFIMISELSLFYFLLLSALILFIFKVISTRTYFKFTLFVGLVFSIFYWYIELFWRACPHYIIENLFGHITPEKCNQVLFVPLCTYCVIALTISIIVLIIANFSLMKKS